MIYLAWAGFYEGSSDRAYYNVLLPRLMDEITRAERTQDITVAEAPVTDIGRSGRTASAVAREACSLKNAVHVLFIHADTGGSARAETLDERSAAYCRAIRSMCGWPSDRCVILAPRHETEAWVLADVQAVAGVLGFTGNPGDLGLPLSGAAAEALTDPKATLANAERVVVGPRRRRDGSRLFTSIAQSQRLECLRQCHSFQAFERALRRALISLGCLAPAPGDL